MNDDPSRVLGSERRSSAPVSTERERARDTLPTTMAVTLPPPGDDEEEAGPETWPRGLDAGSSHVTLLPPAPDPEVPPPVELFTGGLFAELRSLKERFAAGGLLTRDHDDPNENARAAAAVTLVCFVDFLDQYRRGLVTGRRRRLEVNSGLQGEKAVILRIGFAAPEEEKRGAR